MQLLTIESKFALLLANKIRWENPSHLIMELLMARHHLWPYFLYPGQDTFRSPLGYNTGTSVLVRVYRGRWLTDCPFCSSAQEASETDRWFFCAGCKNTSAGNQSILVSWPDNFEEIETVLMTRPFMDARNWFPNETVEDLAHENEIFLGAV